MCERQTKDHVYAQVSQWGKLNQTEGVCVCVWHVLIKFELPPSPDNTLRSGRRINLRLFWLMSDVLQFEGHTPKLKFFIMSVALYIQLHIYNVLYNKGMYIHGAKLRFRSRESRIMMFHGCQHDNGPRLSCWVQRRSIYTRNLAFLKIRSVQVQKTSTISLGICVNVCKETQYCDPWSESNGITDDAWWRIYTWTPLSVHSVI